MSSREEQERLQRVKRLKLIFMPIRLTIGLLLFSLPAGGPHRFYAELPGQVFGLLMAFQVIVERLLQAPDAGGKKRDSASFAVGWIAYFLCYCLAIADWFWLRPHWAPWPYNEYWIIAAVSLCLGGQVIRAVAIKTLGRFFTSSVRVHENQTVIQHGLYAYVRHPSYTGLLLVSLGYAVLFGSLVGMVAFVLFVIPALANRISVEEKVLRRELGDEYRQYCKRVKRLIPYVY